MEHLNVISEFYENYYSSIDFKKWQDEFSSKIYSHLLSKSKEDSREDKIVGRLCKAMSNQKYNGLHIESKKIHGGNISGVKFDHSKNGKELADMVIVSVVTFHSKIILLKTAFIQNKKATERQTTSWSCEIEPNQLFLLKNFPKFTGTKGIFNNGFFKGKEITFLNHSGTLGNYGIFTPDGDMVFLTARNVFCNQSSGGTITFDNIKKAASLSIPLGDIVDSFCPYLKSDCCCVKFKNEYDRIAFSIGRYDSPFFNNYSYALDVHEIVKQLTYFNIGEPLNTYRHITDDYLYCYTKDLLQSFGCTIDNENNLNRSQKNNDNHLNRDQENNDISVNVVLNHLEL